MLLCYTENSIPYNVKSCVDVLDDFKSNIKPDLLLPLSSAFDQYYTDISAINKCHVMLCYVMLGKDALLPIHTEDDNGKSDTEAEEEDDDEVIIVPRPGAYEPIL